jgi:hypothetical protein
MGSCPHSAWPDAAHIPLGQMGQQQPCSHPAEGGHNAEPDQASSSAAFAADEAPVTLQDTAAGLRHRQAARPGGGVQREASKPPFSPRQGAKLSTAAAPSDGQPGAAHRSFWQLGFSSAALEKQYQQWMAEQLLWVGAAAPVGNTHLQSGANVQSRQDRAGQQLQGTPVVCMHAASHQDVHGLTCAMPAIYSTR